MSINRRNLIGATVVLGAAAPVMQGLAAIRAQAATTVGTSIEDSTALAERYFKSKGYAAEAPKPLITGADYNGGLTYDEDGFGNGSTRSLYVIQPCARVEDAEVQRKPGTLPFFTMFALYPAEVVTAQRRTSDLLEFLTSVAGLDPKRLRVTTTELAKPLFADFERYGISGEQIRLRPVAEAQADGAGSGWFEPEGHPNAPAFASYSVEFVMEDGNEIEIAESAVEFAPPHNGVVAVGLERLAMARNDKLMSWDDAAKSFRQAAEAEAQHSGKPLPGGYFNILGLPNPG
ncbi:MAG: hypothetical protein WCJ41_21160 [Aestuariivirga sp.]|uniref:hypothetical protein n=1 Tax=Aestuariivirga sp. TaxID=2650926 RepID=UPI003019A3E3